MRNCKNCKHSEPIGGGLACMGQKGMPFVKPTDCCDGWKTNRQTNADCLRSMTDEEMANAITNLIASMIDIDEANRGYYYGEVLKCLKREARF